MRDRYRIFLTTAETGNLTRAAEALHYTQSGVSHVIADLEEEMGFPLFVRERNGVTLTKQGEQILEDVRRLVRMQDQLNRRTALVREQVAGSVTVGIVTSAAVHTMPRMVRDFRQEFPQIELRFRFGCYREIEEWLHSGLVDCGFLTGRQRTAMDTFFIRTDPMVAVLSAGHPLAGQESVSLDELAEENFILQPEGSDPDIDAVLGDRRRDLRVAYTLSDDLAILSLAAAGMGVSIMSRRIADVADYGTVLRPVAPAMNSVLELACLDRERLSPAASVFFRACESICPESKGDAAAPVMEMSHFRQEQPVL